MKIHTKFIKIYKTSDVTLSARIRYGNDCDYNCAFMLPSKKSIKLYTINYPIYFSDYSRCRTPYPPLPCFYV